MKPFKLGVLGYGKMGKSLIDGLLVRGFIDEDHIHLYTPHSVKSALADHPDMVAHPSAEDLVNAVDVVLCCVKPQILPEVIMDLRLALRSKVLISIAAGIRTDQLIALVDPTTQVLRVMPNLAVQVLKGVTLMSKAHTVDPDWFNACAVMFQNLGTVMLIDEDKMDIGSVLTGSMPAYLAFFLDSVKLGSTSQFSEAETLEMLYETLKGTVAYLESTGITPLELINRVCSPNGSTLEGIRYMRDQHVEDLIAHAVRQSEARAKALGNVNCEK
jgi:pyrroline-5-carboxylate reductase